MKDILLSQTEEDDDPSSRKKRIVLVDVAARTNYEHFKHFFFIPFDYLKNGAVSPNAKPHAARPFTTHRPNLRIR